jgi:hypothetical protein
MVCLIKGATASADMAVMLHPCEAVDFNDCETHADYQEMAANQETVTKLEELVESWCKQIELVQDLIASMIY